MIRRHPGVAGFVLLSLVSPIRQGIRSSSLVAALTYIAAVACGILLTDLYVRWRRGSREAAIPVRHPGLEIVFASGCLLITWALLMNHFAWRMGPPGLTSIAMIFFVSSLPLVLFDLLVVRYSIEDIGFRRSGFGLAVVILLCFAALASATHTWMAKQTIWTEFHGSVLVLARTALFAAFSEEFLRLTWQTRLGALLKNPAASWFITAVIWSGLHYPSVLSFHVLGMVPLGLLWGYVIFRTRSLLPTCTLHAFNFLWAFNR